MSVLEEAKYSLRMKALSIHDHRRDVAGLTYVYAVLSRRAGGVSVGINLNPNNACNWRCIYCQVPNLQRGGPPPIDLDQLEHELRTLLARVDALPAPGQAVAAASPRIVDVAFSGNGEPTSAPEFPAAVERVARVIDDQGLAVPPLLRLITNGSLLDRATVQRGIAAIGARQGEVWFKVDAGDTQQMRRINAVAYAPATVLRRLRRCGELCPTWVQTCVFACAGEPPTAAWRTAYLELLSAARDRLAGVHLYGLARPSQQPEAYMLERLPTTWLEALAQEIRAHCGLEVRVSP